MTYINDRRADRWHPKACFKAPLPLPFPFPRLPVSERSEPIFFRPLDFSFSPFSPAAKPGPRLLTTRFYRLFRTPAFENHITSRNLFPRAQYTTQNLLKLRWLDRDLYLPSLSMKNYHHSCIRYRRKFITIRVPMTSDLS